MDRKEAIRNKINFAIVSKYEIELTIFINRCEVTFYKDLTNNRCYQEDGTISPNPKFQLVKRRIKNIVFDDIYKTCLEGSK